MSTAAGLEDGERALASPGREAKGRRRGVLFVEVAAAGAAGVVAEGWGGCALTGARGPGWEAAATEGDGDRGPLGGLNSVSSVEKETVFLRFLSGGRRRTGEDGRGRGMGGDGGLWSFGNGVTWAAP